MAKTNSEIVFENYCKNGGITCKRILEGGSKSPDYFLIIDGLKIVVEVKEIVPNEAEREAIRLAEEGNALINPPACTPGERVRKKIKESSAQIKARTEKVYPSLLVLFDRGSPVGHLDPYEIRVAMYGLEQVHVAVPRNYSVRPCFTGMSYGPKRKMTEGHNTSISAIGVLYTPNRDEILLDVYHNKFAAVPLNSRLLAKYGTSQFELEDGVIGNTAKWKEISAHDLP